MIIRGARPEAGWYALDKRISEDGRLSWAARGLLVFLLGKPDNWRVSVEHLRAQTKGARIRTGRDGIYALLGELEAAGYMTTRQQRRADGTMGPVDYVVHEHPVAPLPDEPEAGQPDPAQPEPAAPDTAGTTLVKTDTPAKTEQKKGRSAPMTLPAWLPAEAWQDWHVYRNSRKGWTQKARELSLRTLTELYEQGHDPKKVIERSIEHGWTGLFPTPAGEGVKHGNSRNLSASEQVRAAVARRGGADFFDGQCQRVG